MDAFVNVSAVARPRERGYESDESETDTEVSKFCAEHLCLDVCDLLHDICFQCEGVSRISFCERRFNERMPKALNRMLDTVCVSLHTEVSRHRLARIAMGLASMNLPTLCVIGE